MKFLVVTSAPTLQKGQKYLAYAPYVIEMDMWFKDVQEVGIISPGSYPDKVFTKEFDRQNIRFFKIPFFKFAISESIFLFINSPYILFQILRAFMWADCIHLRGPGNIGLLGCLMQIFFPHKPKTAKYAGNWDPEAKQPWSYKLQKWILSNTFLTRNMKVLVYGKWPNQTKNILPFFTASFKESEKEVVIKDFKSPYKFLFIGGLVTGKQPLWALQLVEVLNKRCFPAELHIYGDGPLKNDLEKKAENKDYIHLHGNKPLDVLKQAYKDSHFLVLASKSEGWPKAVAEGMFFGCIPIATAVSCVPWMLGGGSRGILISEDDLDRNRVESGERKVDSQDDEEKLPDTFQKNRQFECFPNTAEAVSENVSRTGFSETPAYRQGRLEVTSCINNELNDALEATVQKIIELTKDPDEMRRMSREAQEWSQEYTLERFEEEIKKLLSPQPPKGEQLSKL